MTHYRKGEVHLSTPSFLPVLFVFIIIHTHAQEQADGIHHLRYLCEDKQQTLQPLCWRVFANADASRADMKYVIYSQVDIGITHSSCRFIKK